MSDRTLTGQKKIAYIDIPAGLGNAELIALVADKKIRVLGGILFFSAAGDFRLLSNTTAISGIQRPSGAGSWSLQKSREYTTEAGQALNVSRSVSVTITGEIEYDIIDG